MKPRDQRFFGDGNSSVGDDSGIRRKVWQIKCGLCGNTAIVHLSRGFLPHNVVVKKFRQQGWIVGAKSGDDVCDKCCQAKDAVQKPVSVTDPHVTESADAVSLLRQQLKIANGDRARLQSQNGELRSENSKLRSENSELVFKKNLETEGYSRVILDVHGLLMFERVEDALRIIEAAFPSWPWERRLPKEKGSVAKRERQPKDDVGFDAWLSELESHRGNPQNGANKGS